MIEYSTALLCYNGAFDAIKDVVIMVALQVSHREGPGGFSTGSHDPRLQLAIPPAEGGVSRAWARAPSLDRRILSPFSVHPVGCGYESNHRRT